MKPGRSRALFSLGALLALLACSPQDATRSPQKQVVGLKPVNPSDVLREMATAMANADQLTFKVRRHADPGLLGGRETSESAEIEIAVLRPSKVKARTNDGAGIHYFYADGARVSLFDETMKRYSTVPIGGTIDEMFARLDEKYDFKPRLAGFLMNDPYKAIAGQIESDSYQGKETVNGVECHHLALAGRVADADLWVSASDQLPRKFVASFKDRE